MPLYDFRCKVCEHVFEVNQKMDDPNPPCPHVWAEAMGESVDDWSPVICGGETEKLITGGTFHLKGGGWAAEGYSR